MSDFIQTKSRKLCPTRNRLFESRRKLSVTVLTRPGQMDIIRTIFVNHYTVVVIMPVI